MDEHQLEPIPGQLSLFGWPQDTGVLHGPMKENDWLFQRFIAEQYLTPVATSLNYSPFFGGLTVGETK